MSQKIIPERSARKGIDKKIIRKKIVKKRDDLRNSVAHFPAYILITKI